MDNLPTVLLYGRDEHLLETRKLVLLRAGFKVRTAMRWAEFEGDADAVAPDVVVLCHTLSDSECDAALSNARTHWPGARRLALTAGDRGCRMPRPSVTIDQAVDSMDGPLTLIRTISYLIEGPAYFQPQAL